MFDLPDVAVQDHELWRSLHVRTGPRTRVGVTRLERDEAGGQLACGAVILSDHTIREELAAGHIEIDPLDETCIQPSSVDLHLDRYFRVFRNHTMRVIDVKEDQEDLTELVEIAPEEEPFILHPGEFVLGSTIERVKLPTDLVARLEGKALSLTTEVPTPAGWRTMGALRPGDQVFDELGRPTVVLAVTDTLLGRPCFDVVFSDGSVVTADAAHQWVTTDRAGRSHGRRRSKVVTTEEIASQVRVRGEFNHQVALASPAAYSDRELPIDPYVLGAWLGDGTSAQATITCADEELLGHKHIPDEYLVAGESQRLALLQGLMDTDGYVDKWGRCEFTTVRPALADQVRELVASLGYRPVIAKKTAWLNGVDCGPKYDVTFTPHGPVFRLTRKLIRQKTAGRFHRFRAIVDVRPVESVPVRCIQVAAPSGQFLVTRSYIPTHNSSLGRLGLLIHSSLPGSETVPVLHDGALRLFSIQDVVRKRIEGSVVGFDPETFETGFHRITGWYEGPPDQIFEVRLASGRRVRVTGGHNLFTLDRRGQLAKTRTLALAPGTRVAIPRRVPAPDLGDPVIDVLPLLPESEYGALVLEGPTVADAVRSPNVRAGLRSAGYRHDEFYVGRGILPLAVAMQFPALVANLGNADRVRAKGGHNGVPCVIPVTEGLAWFLGLYVAEGYRRRGQVVVSNTDRSILDRAESVLADLGLPVYRRDGVAITCSSVTLSMLLQGLGIGDGAPNKRLPDPVLGWPRSLQDACLQGMMDGDGSSDDVRDSYWTSSPGLAADLLLLCELRGQRAAAWHRNRNVSGLYQVAIPKREHKLLRSVPLPDKLLVELRAELGLAQNDLARMAGFRNATDLSNIERRIGRDAVRLPTLERLRSALTQVGRPPSLGRLDRLVDGDLAWDAVEEVVDTGDVEPIFDLEVRPNGRHIENFLAGSGGVLVSNTAGFVDAGWDGQLTLELSNVANLPITLYPGMKIGQISFIRMTTAADNPYGSSAVGSKYQGQVGPRPSRYFENFRK